MHSSSLASLSSVSGTFDVEPPAAPNSCHHTVHPWNAHRNADELLEDGTKAFLALEASVALQTSLDHPTPLGIWRKNNLQH